MAEPESFAAPEQRRSGFDEPSGEPATRDLAQVGGHTVRSRSHHGTRAMELSTLDGAALEDVALGRREPLEARLQHTLDRGRDRERGPVADHHPGVALASQVSLVDQHPDRLLEEEGIPLCTPHDRSCLGREPGGPHQVLDELIRLLVRQWLDRQRHGSRVTPRPCGAFIQQFGPRRTEEDDGVGRGEVGDVLEQIQQRRLRPVHILEDGDERSSSGERLEQPANRPVGLFRRRGRPGEAEELRQPLGDQRGLRRSLQQPLDPGADLVGAVPVVDPGDLGEDLDDWPVRDALAVGEAAAMDHLDVLGRDGHEFVDQP